MTRKAAAGSKERTRSLPADQRAGEKNYYELIRTAGFPNTPDGNPMRPAAASSFLVRSLLGSMAKDDEPMRPMTLGSMRRHGVRGCSRRAGTAEDDL